MFIRADFASATQDVLYGMGVIMAIAAVVAFLGLRGGVQEAPAPQPAAADPAASVPGVPDLPGHLGAGRDILDAGLSGGAPTGQVTRQTGVAAGVVRSTSLRMVSSESTAARTSKPALARMASRKPCRNTAGCACASPVRPASGGIAATNSSDAARATALLTPLAMPACRTSADASTVAVSGATTAHSPSPNTTIAGSTSARYDVCGPTRVISTIPRAATAARRSSGSAGRSAAPARRPARTAGASRPWPAPATRPPRAASTRQRFAT